MHLWLPLAVIKSLMRNLSLILIILTALAACRPAGDFIENESVGYAQGTTYQIKYLTSKKADFQEQFDSIFSAIDHSMSTYQENSIISRLNRGESDVMVDVYFKEVMLRSLEVADETGGFFDPSVGPLVRVWGFSETRPQPADVKPGIDSILNFTGYERIKMSGNKVEMPDGYQIDFNAIAQGYTVDVLARFLKSRKVEHYMVEVGGEVRTSGHNIRNESWVIGIDKPADEIDVNDRFQVIVKLDNQSLATSGNYRKFWVDEETGLRYAHTIDPHTGMPARNTLLSVSVLAKNCMDADAYATALMAMGLDRAWEFVKSHQDLEAYFVSAGLEEGWLVRMTPGFKEHVLTDPEKE